jgi:hypothetical protein
MKELLRAIIFYLPFNGEFEATSGTLKFRFLWWLYDGETE